MVMYKLSLNQFNGTNTEVNSYFPKYLKDIETGVFKLFIGFLCEGGLHRIQGYIQSINFPCALVLKMGETVHTFHHPVYRIYRNDNG